VPALVQFQIRDGPHAGEPTTERGEIERLAWACQAAGCRADLDSTVVETRFNVVRSGVPDTVDTARRLRDYLRADARGGPATGPVHRRANIAFTSCSSIPVSLAKRWIRRLYRWLS